LILNGLRKIFTPIDGVFEVVQHENVYQDGEDNQI
jgi:hypothetical protein